MSPLSCTPAACAPSALGVLDGLVPRASRSQSSTSLPPPPSFSLPNSTDRARKSSNESGDLSAAPVVRAPSRSGSSNVPACAAMIKLIGVRLVARGRRLQVRPRAFFYRYHGGRCHVRSEEHTSELQSLRQLVR